MELEQINSKAKKYGVPVIKPKSHSLLESLVKSKNPKHILEIGTAVGYSAITMLNSCDGDIVTIEHNPKLAAQAKANLKRFGLIGRATIKVCDCHTEIAKMLASKKYDSYFDFIFLDGPKAQYSLLLQSLIMLLKGGGTFVADNVLFRGYVSGENSQPTKRYKTIVKRLNTFIENCKNEPKFVNFKLISTEDGIIYAEKVKDEQQ